MLRKITPSVTSASEDWAGQTHDKQDTKGRVKAYSEHAYKLMYGLLHIHSAPCKLTALGILGPGGTEKGNFGQNGGRGTVPGGSYQCRA